MLRRAVAQASAGRPAAVVVHGEAGVGKTRLLTELCREFGGEVGADHATVLWGRCVQFGAALTPYLPLVRALEGDTLAGADRLLDRLRGASESSGRLMREIADLLATAGEEQVLVLVVDDLQWADPSSLAVLGYLVAGFREQRLLLLLTYRDEDLVEGHPLNTWLADVRRLPGVEEQVLARLSHEEVEEQVSLLLGRPAPHELVADVVKRSQGNPYFTELLVRGVASDAHSLPAEVPEALRAALLARWHALPQPSREVSRLVAVAGRPVDEELLQQVTSVVGVPGDAVDACVREAVGGAVLRREGPQQIWFRHPLLPEVLEASLLPGERRRLHRAFVDALRAGGAPAAERLSDLSLHCEGAGLADDAFEAALAAAERAASVQAPAEEHAQRERAARLYATVSHAVRARHPSRAVLLRDTASAAHRAGDPERAWVVGVRATEVVDEQTEPLLAAHLMLTADELAMDCGRSGERDTEVLRRAARLTDRHPPSPEGVLAHVGLAEAAFWLGDLRGARRHSDRAVQIAEAVGTPGPLSMALTTRPLVLQDDEGVAAARECYRLALESGHPRRIGEASIAICNGPGETQGELEEAITALLAGHRAAAAGGELAYAALVATYAGRYLLTAGRLTDAWEVLRSALTLRAPGRVAIQARSAAMLLAVRQGRMLEADGHRARIDELWPGYEHNPAWNGPPDLAEYLLARQGPEAALGMLAATMRREAEVDPGVADEMLMLAARAAAEWVAQGRQDRAGSRSAALRALDAVEAVRREHHPAPFDAADRNRVMRAVRASYAAERLRAEEPPGSVEAWREAADVAETAGTRWWRAHALLSLARCFLGRRDVASAGTALRTALDLAVEMQAGPLRAEIEALARSGRVSLDRPAAGQAPRRTSDGSPLVGLTAREREVLGFIVAGHTYREIAEQLFISEKTVSVHVSNVLRKTGTANRVEVSDLARRLAPEGLSP